MKKNFFIQNHDNSIEFIKNKIFHQYFLMILSIIVHNLTIYNQIFHLLYHQISELEFMSKLYVIDPVRPWP